MNIDERSLQAVHRLRLNFNETVDIRGFRFLLTCGGEGKRIVGDGNHSFQRTTEKQDFRVDCCGYRLDDAIGASCECIFLQDGVVLVHCFSCLFTQFICRCEPQPKLTLWG